MTTALLTKISNRDFTDPLVTPALTYAVQSYAWQALFGPNRATLNVTGEEQALWELIELLRCPIDIYDERGEYVWWGYIAAVKIVVGSIEIGVSLDTMANRVAVAYSFVPAGSATVGTRATTTWAQNDDSVATYGAKDLLHSLSGATVAQAEALRAALLAAGKYPIPIVSLASGQGLSATLECRGWHTTLDWKYYTNTNTASVATTTQISDMVTSVGQFFAATDVINASGISSSEYRDGDTKALPEIVDLLETGTTNSRRLLATVQQNRRLRVYEEPAAGTANYFLLADGTLRDENEVAVLPQTCPVGVWAKLKDVIPATADVTKLADPSLIFIEEAEYNAQTGKLTLQPRGIPSVWDLTRIRA